MTVREKAERLHKSVNTFVITCVGGDGYPLSKAVVPGRFRETLAEMYFCTNTSSNFTAEVVRDGKAGVYFYSRRLVWQGCMLKGRMEIVADQAVKNRYWQNRYKNAYPQKSPADPDFCLLKFSPASGRYYSWFRIEDFAI